MYRLVMDNCLEKKIYDRQINKQGMADRVVDECNPDAHLSIKEVTNLCWDNEQDTEPRDFSAEKDKYIDVVLQKVLDKFSSRLSKVCWFFCVICYLFMDTLWWSGYVASNDGDNECHYHNLRYRPLDTCYGYYKTESFHHFRCLSKLLFLSVDIILCGVCVTVEGGLDIWIY